MREHLCEYLIELIQLIYNLLIFTLFLFTCVICFYLVVRINFFFIFGSYCYLKYHSESKQII